MTDIEKIEDISRHIHNVQENARLLGTRLIKAGEVDLGIKLIANSMSHDQSKFAGIEWDHLHRGNPDADALALAVTQHNRTNPHHPEYWGTVHRMPRIYVAEMLCDWKARSNEFGTSLQEWINGPAAKKFGFNQQDKVFEEISYFLNLLCDKPFAPVRTENTL